jgi:8-oxo-dGTP diphosphatase
MNHEKRPLVGVAVIIVRDGKLLLGKRKQSHGSGTWQFPGGHLEYEESIEACARREVSEETGLQIKNIQLGPYTNDIFKQDGKHYITIYVMADYAAGDVTVKEPDKCEKWRWFEWENLPEPVFLPIRNLKKLNLKWPF